MTKKLLRPLTTLTLSLLLFSSVVRADETNTNAVAAAAAAAPAATNAPAAAPASTDPVPDPGGIKTGMASDAQSPAGPFVVTAPTDLTGDDLKDTNKVAAFKDAKKAYDDYTAAIAKEPMALKLADAVGHNRVAINFMWTLVTGFLVMFMQAGFALVETGLCRAKNAGHTMAMNFMIYPMGMLGFYVCGFAFMFGGLGSIGTMGNYAGLNHEITIHMMGHDWGILGWKGFMLQGAGYDTAAFALFLFQMVFMDTTATIPTGGAAERWKFSAFMIYGCCIGTIMYPLFGNWVWGGGWLSQLGVMYPALGHGHVDFAGSSVVHMQGGVICLIFCWLIGPRHGKYNKEGKIVHPITPHSIPLVMLGTFILAFGWFGFNPGSTLAGTDLRIAVVAVNTMIASATGALATTLYMWWFKTKKPDPSMMCNGMLAGLVAITAPCAFVSAGGAAWIGIISGIHDEALFFQLQRLPGKLHNEKVPAEVIDKLMAQRAHDEYRGSHYNAFRWVGERSIWLNYLARSPNMWFVRVGDEVWIQWDNIDNKVEGIDVWTARCGTYAISVEAFLAECRGFSERLLSVMESRIVSVENGSARAQIPLDTASLRNQLLEFKDEFEKSLSAEYQPDIDWEEAEKAMRAIALKNGITLPLS